MRFDQRIRLIGGSLIIILAIPMVLFASSILWFGIGTLILLGATIMVIGLWWEIKTGAHPPPRPVARRNLIVGSVVMAVVTILWTPAYPLLTSVFGIAPETAQWVTIVSFLLVGVPGPLIAVFLAQRWGEIAIVNEPGGS